MSQGHWRRLRPGSIGEGRFGEDTPGMTWVDRKESRASDKAKHSGKVPPPVLVRFDKERGFGILAVPGGEVMFAVHKSVLQGFMEAVKDSDNWTGSSKVKEIMLKAEKEGKFGIFQTENVLKEY